MGGKDTGNHLKSPGISQRHLERLVDILGIGIYRLNLKTGDIALNRVTTKLTGHDLDDLPTTDNTRESLIVEDDLPLVNNSLSGIVSGQQDHYRIEYRMRRRDSSVARFEEAAFISDYDENGEPLCMSAMALDLSRLDWAEEGARSMEAEIKRLVSARDDRLLAEENRILRAVNRASAMVVGGFHQDYDTVLVQSLRMLGESVGASYVGLWRNAGQDDSLLCSQKYRWVSGARATGSEKTRVFFTYDAMRPDWKERLGEKRCIICDENGVSPEFRAAFGLEKARSILLSPLYLHGVFWGMIGFGRDEKTAFTPSEADALLLGATTIAFTVARHETLGKLSMDKEQAVADTAAKGEFLSHMSHEMRTPLNAIIGMTGIALREKDPERLREYLGKVEVSSHLMLSIINDVLDMAKIESGKLEIAKEPFNFALTLKNAENIVRVKMDEKKQRFTVNCDSAITRLVISDEHRLLQVIVNLLNNAMKFTPEEGTISLSASQRNIGKNRIKLRVEVRDSGIGLDGEQQKRLFNAFEQADSSITRKYGGTGLGLTICKKILNALGGDIWVKSKPEEGSCFYFELEMETGKPVTEAAGAAPAGAAETSLNLRDWKNRTILLADDVEINREIVEIYLAETGATVVSVENGVRAVEEFAANPGRFDLILMDVQMPVMDGFSATREIRGLGNERGRTVPIIAMTANAFREDIDDCIAAGMNEHIAKPIAMNAFFGVLEKYLT